MLILSRKKLEAVRIGPSVEVTILEIRGDRVRLGITAPDSVDIRRTELTGWIPRAELITTDYDELERKPPVRSVSDRREAD